MEQEQLDILLDFFKALANETRLKIVGILANQMSSVEQLAAQLGLKKPTVSRHLAKLKHLDLVRVHPEGHVRLYELDSQALQRMNKEILSREVITSPVDDMAIEAWERKVLKAFLEGERIRQIPAGHKRCLVVLRWLATKFELGVRYPERAVNEIIKRHYADHTTLRRALIDNGLMQRERGIYWRLPEADEELSY